MIIIFEYLLERMTDELFQSVVDAAGGISVFIEGRDRAAVLLQNLKKEVDLGTDVRDDAVFQRRLCLFPADHDDSPDHVLLQIGDIFIVGIEGASADIGFLGHVLDGNPVLILHAQFEKCLFDRISHPDYVSSFRHTGPQFRIYTK